MLRKIILSLLLVLVTALNGCGIPKESESSVNETTEPENNSVISAEETAASETGSDATVNEAEAADDKIYYDVPDAPSDGLWVGYIRSRVKWILCLNSGDSRKQLLYTHT